MYVPNSSLLRGTLYDPRFERDACGIGFVVNIAGEKSNRIVRQALTVLMNLSHRGACGAEPNTGDGAGILLQTPHAFLNKVCADTDIRLPAPGQYGVGIVFLPPDPVQRLDCEQRFAEIVKEEGQSLLGWRTVPTDGSSLGQVARSREPRVRQVFIGRDPRIADDMAFERKLYVIRRRAEKAIRYATPAEGRIEGGDYFYVASLSYKTIIYKGMLTALQLEEFYPDLADPDMETALALIHARFSTNTFPNWERAHPFRYMIHNGEINTIRGNLNWMHARQAMFESNLFGDDLPEILPVINPDGSDSAMFDNCLELLVLVGRSLPHAVMMMIPEPWARDADMSDAKKAFYEYHSCLMEPWDGPASVAFTDGRVVGAILDRNGLRPSRYYITRDNLVVMASEVGVLDIPPEDVLHKGRLQPGRMLLIDTEEKRLISDEELKHRIATDHPYCRWLDQHMVSLEDLSASPAPTPAPNRRGAPVGPSWSVPGGQFNPSSMGDQGAVFTTVTLLQRQYAFGYTFEDLNLILAPMARDGLEPIGSMGNDTPPAVLSHKPQLLYSYFKQLFAQVTNPPIDALREEIITSVGIALGAERNLLRPEPESCRQIRLKSPIITDEELEKLRRVDRPGFKAVTLPILFHPPLHLPHLPLTGEEKGGAALTQAMDRLCEAADRAIAEGATILILSDRGVDREHAAIPALLAVAGVHHHLIRQGTRTRVGLALESGEPREVHHFALLIGYGAGAINPYLVYETLGDMIRRRLLSDITYTEAVENYNKAVVKGVVKVMSKMGICTIGGYRGAQIFEALGLDQAMVDRYFTGTPSRIGGVGMDELAAEAQMRHARGFAARQADDNTLDVGGHYQWRRDGEYHALNPLTVHMLQRACRTADYRVYKEYAGLMNNHAETPWALRGLLELKFAPKPIPLEEVEPLEAICKRFKTGGMSYGSISKEAHEALAIAMNRIGGKSNSGEGGEDPARYTPGPNGDLCSSAIKQVASGRFGVTSLYLVNAQEIQIKIAQGAKPGEGGQLPGRKVYPWIARVRHSTPGVGLISPPPHHDIYSIEDLAELIYDLKNANPQARISVKLVSEVGVGTIAAGVAKGHADVILISGYDGGTGASPQTGIKHAGLPWELGIAETHQTLLVNNLRSRVVLETDGQLRTGRDVVVAALLGAEEFGFATAPLVALGCTMMRVCHLDTCPAGVATQNPALRKNFTGDPAYVVNFMCFVAQEVRELMACLGFRTFNEMVGRSDRLAPCQPSGHWKARGLDLSRVLAQPEVPPTVGRYHQIPQHHALDQALDNRVLLPLCEPALLRGEPVQATLPIRNADRTVGTLLGSEITRRYGADGLPEDTIQLRFQGSAGQSFGAFIPRGITLIVEGDANDYIGKGLSGGKIIVYPPSGTTFAPEENIIIGNVAFYGATSGEAYVRGMAGERFCVRNSGVTAVVEAVGDHGCEYMTGGRVVVLGPTGRNFAAGMSGGIAYVLDEAGTFPRRCNQEMVLLEDLEGDEVAQVRGMIQRHVAYTNSTRGRNILECWDRVAPQFVKVIPKDYKRMLQALCRVQAAGLSGEEAIMVAFEENIRDAARISGN
jgi:glutamate synthase (ferredoxin)